MRALRSAPTGATRDFDPEEIIVSKTDPKGIITYTNDVFLRVSGYTREELIGAPHNIIRHPDMPRGVYRLLWQELTAGREVFALVENLCRDGASYWVLAHVTPSRDAGGRVVGYHSNRRRPDPEWITAIRPVYARMRAVEQGHPRPAEAARASLESLEGELAQSGTTYDAFIWGVIRAAVAA
ncbi:MAG: PAS domain S-box protein [Kineosporiaceae bacterium]|nr:PAS domain S-box protein [Kineosporiaceae bacterium]